MWVVCSGLFSRIDNLGTRNVCCPKCCLAAPLCRDVLEGDAAILLMQLLNLQDAGSEACERAGQRSHRHRAMVGVVASVPPVGLCLAQALCTPGSYNLATRLDCIDVLQGAARELSGEAATSVGPQAEPAPTPVAPALESGGAAAAAALLEAKTRRWGHTARLHHDTSYGGHRGAGGDMVGRPNRFAPHANEWIWGLLWAMHNEAECAALRRAAPRCAEISLPDRPLANATTSQSLSQMVLCWNATQGERIEESTAGRRPFHREVCHLPRAHPRVCWCERILWR
eukprot:SAG11_NODE_4273_length_1973_cov_1.548559_2_plen_284_part_00